MRSNRSITVAKAVSIVGFAVLVTCTYGLRSEVLSLNRIRFSADEERAAHELERFKASYPERVAAHEAELKQFELLQAHHARETEHYERLVALAQTDFDKYARVAKEGALDFPALPRIPRMPSPPEPPGFRDRMAEINAEFAARRFHYFDVTGTFNWVACVGAIALVSGLLYLLMFDVNGARLLYVLVLVLSFIFMIGPSFHTILSGIVGFLEMPG